MMKLLRIAILALVIITQLIFVVPAYATADPDDDPTIESCFAFRNLLETGDMVVVWEANIPYASLPSTSVDDTFIWRLIDTDGTTMLGSTVGYAYNDSGYGYNVYSMYFSLSDMTAFGIVWGTAYTLRLSGNPIVFTTPPTYDYDSRISYTTLTTTEDNQEELATKIIIFAQDLNEKWGYVGTTASLTDETESGTKLSTEGSAFFRGAIYGVQALAPDAFPEQIIDIEATDRSWNSTYTTNLENQYSGTWVETARNASIAFMGTGWNTTELIILLAILIGLFIGNLSLTNNVWDALIDCCFVIIIATRLGVIGLVVSVLLAAISLIYIGTKIWRSIPGT